MAGLLAGAAGVAVAEAAAAVVADATSPLLAVSNVAVDLTPRPLKEWAVATFGSADKAVLLGGAVLVLATLLVAVGLTGARRPGRALFAMVGLNVVGAVAAVADRTADASFGARLVAPVTGLAVSVLALLLLLRAIHPDRRLRAAVPRRVEGDDLPATFDRRRFVVTALAVAAVAAGGGLLDRAFAGAAARSRAAVAVPRPDIPAGPVPAGASLGVAGLAPHVSPNAVFYRVDTALVVPEVPVVEYRLRVHGMVDRPLELSYADLLSRRLVERRITLTCVSNPVGGDLVDNTSWIGVPVADLLAEAGVRPGADAVRSTSADDMTIGTPLSALTDGRDALLAVAMGSQPLPLEHGFPVRMVVPGLYGYVSATKWLVDLEVTRFADFTAYWTERGYAEQAPIKTSSRIDVPRASANLRAGPVTVAGLAWSQGRGIDAVEVRVDEGRWRQASLAVEDNEDTWRQWRWTWQATPGTHRLDVRATDRAGHTQTPRREPIAPDGATGWHSITVTVR